jgi:hypothetical protein
MHIDSAIKMDNTEKIDQYMMIRQNNAKYTDFVKTERGKRERDVKLQEKMKISSRAPPMTIEEIENDPDLGMNDFKIDEPKLQLPPATDSLYVEKPIDKYEPNQQKLQRLRARHEPDENKIIKKKFKPEPTT